MKVAERHRNFSHLTLLSPSGLRSKPGTLDPDIYFGSGILVMPLSTGLGPVETVVLCFGIPGGGVDEVLLCIF